MKQTGANLLWIASFKLEFTNSIENWHWIIMNPSIIWLVSWGVIANELRQM